VVDGSAAVAVVALAAVLAQASGGVVPTADTHSAATTSRQQEQLGVEATPTRVTVTAARCSSTNDNPLLARRRIAVVYVATSFVNKDDCII